MTNLPLQHWHEGHIVRLHCYLKSTYMALQKGDDTFEPKKLLRMTELDLAYFLYEPTQNNYSQFDT